jgi:shikimate dehydrogenase
LLDEVEEGAKAIGAVNTLRVGAQISGYNTDWSGFLADLAELGVAVDGRDCLVIGAGGSARAVAYALAKSGGRVYLLARRTEQAGELAAALQPFVAGGMLLAQPLTALPAVAACTTAALIVNTTPLGMTSHAGRSPWPDDCPFPSGAFVYDLVYNPRETMLMRQAQTAGCTAVNGLGMLVHQGALSFELWTERKPNIKLMREVIGGES